MSANLTNDQNKTTEQLIKELKISRAQLAVLEEAVEARKKAEEETELLKNLILGISEAEDLNSALTIALKRVCESTGWILGQAWIPNNDEECLDCSPAWFTKTKNLEKFRNLSEGFKFPPGKGLPGRVWTSKTSAWVRDVTKDNNFPRAPVAKEVGLKAGLGIPIIAQDKVVAIMEFFMPESKDEDAHLISLISAIANQLGIVIQHKMAEEALKESKTKYKLVAKATNDAIWEWDLITNQLKWNEGIQISFGYSKDEIGPNAKWWYENIHPEDKERIYTSINSFVESNEQFWLEEYRFRCSNGSYAYVTERGFVIKNNAGKSIKMIGGIINITKQKKLDEELKKVNESLETIVEDRTKEFIKINKQLNEEVDKHKQTEKSLKESEEKYRKLIETANEAIFIADTETGFIIDANKQAEKLIGYPVHQVIGMHFTELHPKEKAEEYSRTFREHVESGNGIAEKFYLQHKDGYAIPIEISASVIEVGGKKIIQGIFKDLRKWERAEQTYLQLASIVESTDDAILSWTPDGYNTGCNHATETIYGYTASELRNKHVSTIVPSNRQEELKKLCEKIEKSECIKNFETIRMHKDGRLIDVSLTISPIKDSSGVIKGISTIARDITDQKKLQFELEKVKQRELRNREIRLLEELAKNSPKSDAANKLFGILPLQNSVPGIFNNFLKQFEDLLEQSIKDKPGKLKKSISDELRHIGEELTKLRAGPNDLMEIYNKTLTNKTIELSPDELQLYSEKGRLLLLELMSYLITYYRKQSLILIESNSLKATSRI